MTLSIDEYSNLKRQTTYVVGLPRVTLGAIIVGVLERELGNEVADEVLSALDRAVSPAAIDAQREVDAEVKKIQAKQAKILSTLSITSGIRFMTWGSGHYLVTYDGAPIGSIHALTRSTVSGRKSYSDWIPSRAWWFMEPFDGTPCRTRDEASLVAYDWWTQRMNARVDLNSRVKRLRVPETANVAVTAPVGSLGTVMRITSDASETDWYHVSWDEDYQIGQCRRKDLEAWPAPRSAPAVTS